MSPSSAPPVTVTPLRPADLDEVMAIEEVSFATPWSRASMRAEMEGNRFARFWVARHGAAPAPVLGYLVAWIVYEELRIQNLAVHAACRRRGVAAALLGHALQAGRAAGCLEAVLEVREGNRAALSLYRRHGFQLSGRRAGYYAATGEDALLLTRRLERDSG